MGIVKRQSIKQSIVTYVGILIGMVNVLFIYTKFLDKEQYGIIQFLISNATMLAPIIMFGAASLVIRYFPQFKNEEKNHNGFLSLLLLLLFTGFALFCLICWGFKSSITGLYEDKSILTQTYLFYTIPLVLLISLVQLLTRYTSNFHRIVVPQILGNLLPKIIQPILIIAFFYGLIHFPNILNGILAMYLFIVIGMFAYTKWLGQLSFQLPGNFITKDLRSDMTTYASYGLLGSMGTSIANYIDVYMIGTLIDLAEVAVYTVAFFISSVIDVPRKAIENIVSPILAEAHSKSDFAKIKELYVQTSINQLIVGLFIFIGIWASIDDLFSIMPKGDEYALGKYVVLILGLGTLVDLATGVNAFIIGYSKFFRYNFYLVLVIAVVNIASNFILIPMYYINGAALATFFSKTIYNIIKTGIVWWKMKIHPFSQNTIWVILLSVAVYFISQLIPLTDNVFINIILKSILITILFLGSIVYFRLSPDVDATVNWLLEKVKRK